MVGVSPLNLISYMTALAAPHLSMLAFLETALAYMVFSRYRRVALLSRLVIGSWQEGNCHAVPVQHAVVIIAVTIDFDASFFHAPTPTRRVLVFARHFLKRRQKPDCLAVDLGRVDKHSAPLY